MGVHANDFGTHYRLPNDVSGQQNGYDHVPAGATVLQIMAIAIPLRNGLADTWS